MEGSIKAYWARVAEVRSELDPEVWLTSLAVAERGIKGGVVSCVGRDEAALMLVNKTHRLAEDKEVTAYKQENEIAAREIHETEYKRKQQFAMPRELTDLVELAIKGAQAAQAPPPAQGRTRNRRLGEEANSTESNENEEKGE